MVPPQVFNTTVVVLNCSIIDAVIDLLQYHSSSYPVQALGSAFPSLASSKFADPHAAASAMKVERKTAHFIQRPFCSINKRFEPSRPSRASRIPAC